LSRIGNFFWKFLKVKDWKFADNVVYIEKIIPGNVLGNLEKCLPETLFQSIDHHSTSEKATVN